MAEEVETPSTPGWCDPQPYAAVATPKADA